MSPHLAVSLFLLLGFPGAQPVPSGPPVPVPFIDQCGCLPNPAATSDTCASNAGLEFTWHAEPAAVIGWQYRLDESDFVSVSPGTRSVTYGVPPAVQTGWKVFTLRAIGPKSVQETHCSVFYGYPPDTWLAGPDPDSPSWVSKPNGEKYALLVDGSLAAPIVGSLMSDDSTQVLPAARPERRTFIEIWEDTVFVRFDGDTVHRNSWIVLHNGGFDRDSPYSVHVTEAARELPGFPDGPVLTPGPANGSPVGFRSQAATILSPAGQIALEAISGLYPVFDPNDVFHNPRIGSYRPAILSGRAHVFAFSQDGDGLQDRRIAFGIPGSIDPLTLVQRVEDGTATPYEQGLRTKVLAFYVDRPPYFVTDSPLFVPRPSETFTTSTWNLRLIAGDEDPYQVGSAPGGPAATLTLRRRIQVHGRDTQGNELTYVDPTDYLQEAVALTVPANLAAGPCVIEVQLCDCELCESLPGSGRCVSYSFPVTYQPNAAGASAATASERSSSSTTELLAPYPNPATRGATIPFRLAAPGRVELDVFDLAGHRLRRLGGTYAAGEHTSAWDGADQTGRRVPSGLYLVRLRAGGREAVRKLFVAP